MQPNRPSITCRPQPSHQHDTTFHPHAAWPDLPAATPQILTAATVIAQDRPALTAITATRTTITHSTAIVAQARPQVNRALPVFHVPVSAILRTPVSSICM